MFIKFIARSVIITNNTKRIIELWKEKDIKTASDLDNALQNFSNFICI